jgi:[NiFe] hydrogenase large subunit
MPETSQPATPKSNFSGSIVLDPITRIEGHLRIEVEVKDGKVYKARSSGQLFRGLEMILKGRDPRDAQHITQRACGVCTYVHALAATRCLDQAVGVKIPENARLIRNLVLASQFMHDHIVHFYHLHALDWVDVTGALKADPVKTAKIAGEISPKRKTTAEGLKAVQDRLKAFVESGQLGIFANAYFLGGHPAYRLPPEVNLLATAHYLEALRLQVQAARAMAVFGGKNPHPQFTVAGGVTCYEALTPARLEEFAGLCRETRQFIEEVYLPDLQAIAPYYKDWATIGGCSNFLSFGEFPETEEKLESRWLPPGVIMNRQLDKVQKVNPDEVIEHVAHSWYRGTSARSPFEGVTEPQYTDLSDKERYSWMKAPRYQGKAMETGPLAAVLVACGQGQRECKTLVDGILNQLRLKPEALFSTLGRTAARAVECAAIAARTDTWLNQLKENIRKGDGKIYEEWKMPQEGKGLGMVTAPRGALGHWMTLKNGKIENYQMVVPSTWNLGPRSADGQPGPVEEALLGTPIADPKRPVEVLRTVHSFDPCIACAVHIIDPQSNAVYPFRIL